MAIYTNLVVHVSLQERNIAIFANQANKLVRYVMVLVIQKFADNVIVGIRYVVFAIKDTLFIKRLMEQP